MKYRHVLSRRACLKAGGIAIGLPFLDCMTEKSVFGAPTDVPVSVVSLQHGLGTSDVVLNRGMAGSLRYYQPLVDAKKISLWTNIDMSAAADQPAVAQHHYGEPYLFSGFRTQITTGFNVIPQGPSLQWAIMKQNYPMGLPTLFKFIDVGIYFRRGINYQYTRIYDDRGKNAADFEDLASPVDMFDKIFGKMPTPMAQDPKARAAHSIIDYLIPQYQKYTGAGSPLPARDIAVLKNHLDRVRQLELAVYGGMGQPPKTINITRPMPPDLKYMIDGSSCGDPANVYRVSPSNFETAYQIMADMFIAGLQVDYYRFGNLSFDSPGGHTYFTGPMPYPDDMNYTANGNVHATYHSWNANDANIVKTTTAHNFFVHRNSAAVLSKMDGKDFVGANGKSLLENTLVMVGSEVGTNHDVTRMFHAFSGGAGRFKVGMSSNDRIKAIELYSAIGKSYGMAKVGDGRDYKTDATAILA